MTAGGDIAFNVARLTQDVAGRGPPWSCSAWDGAFWSLIGGPGGRKYYSPQREWRARTSDLKGADLLPRPIPLVYYLHPPCAEDILAAALYMSLRSYVCPRSDLAEGSLLAMVTCDGPTNEDY